MHSLRVMVVALAVLIVAVPSFSQTGTSTIRGTITDPQGRVVPGATVTLTNVGTNAVRTTKSTETGAYTFDLIVPGTYRLQVESTGFRTKAVDNVRALVGKPTETNVQLDIGTKGEVVEVKSSVQDVLVNTQDASLGNVFINQQITQLPLEARNIVDLLSLQPGATREGYVAGARADQSNITLDGVDINNAQTGNADIPTSTNNLIIGSLNNDRGNITTGPVLRLNSEAIEEFRVTTANGNANEGHSSGSQINLVTKSGTNNWHGAGFEFYRSTGFTANDWFNNHATDASGNWAPVPRQPLVRHTYGGGIGGPIVKNKVFFFYSYEGRHDASGQTVSRVVPLASLGQGTINYQYLSGSAVQQASLTMSPANPGPFQAAGIDQFALDALAAAAAKYPANDTTQGDQLNTSGFRFNAPTPTKLNSHVAKFDFNLTNNQTAFVRLNVIHDHQTLPQWLPDTPSPVVWNHPRGLAAGHTWTIGNQWVNNFRYGLTRQAFTQGGNSTGNDIFFRFVFSPLGETPAYPISRITPVHNFTDDVSWIHGKHNVQFGVNIRKISNSRISFENAFDIAETNPSFYLSTGGNIPKAFQQYLNDNNLPGSGGNLLSTREVRDAGTAIIGRFTELRSNFTFAKDGQLLPTGSPAVRDFATQAYDEYIQDTWKVLPNLTLTLGLRYSLERPVYETHGFETQPSVPLGNYFAERVAAGKAGTNFVDPITIVSSGPANGGKPLYNWDKNNFQPRIAAAWSFDGGRSVIRGGFAMTNDYYGQALAVDFDLANAVGYTQFFENHANTFDIGTGSSKPLGPLFTGFGQDVRSIIGTAGGSVPSTLQLPATPSLLDGINTFGERIERSLDSNLHAPTQYVWNLTFERQLPKGSVLSLSYIGRMGRSLLARRDIAAFNNLVDPKTGVDWYTAGTALEKLRQKGVDISQVPGMLPPQIAQYFEDLFPAHLAQILNDYEGLPADPNQSLGGFDPNWTNAQTFLGYQSSNIGFFTANDWTDVQAEIDLALAANGLPIRFMQPQYGALSTWATVGNSNYHALALSLRQRLSSLTFDLNYTWSHSLDDASGLQSETGFGNNQSNGAFILNPLRQRDNYASSDFDIRHNITADAVWQLPFGKGRAFLGDAHPAVDAILGGWQISGIFRWNTGLPALSPFDESQWATNWDVQSNVTPTRPIQACPNKPSNGTPKLFGSCGVDQIYQSLRNAYPGETGVRNIFRFPGYVALDLGLGKSWKMPYNENHQLQLRWDVFNVTNTQHLTGIADFAVAADPGLNGLSAPPDWSNFTQIQGQPRIMQVGVRYSF
ncbi:MAG TPA: TonB-dependent receptor [Terriglobales bacterium]|nr:TonB-dependent receptor [Terriglobales bacterium]